ncbi:MAG: response regulator, partial [Bacteriovoracaceae bacterium]|nr:response regulator [Bacteriovoracaceae bacterium]
MALEILLADPDKKWLELASSFLKDQMYKVDTVCTGKDAQVRMYKKKYFLVILNYSVEDHTGLQVLKFINSTCTAQKVILVLNRTGMLEADGMDEKKLAKMGVMDVLLRPFDLSALTNVLEGNQTYTDMMSTIPKRDTVSEEEDVTSADNEFSTIKTTEFYSPNVVLFDVYIKLGNNRYVKILHAGDKFAKDRIDKYKQKVESLYFKSCDRRKYVRFCSYLATKVVGDKRASGSTKVSLLKSVSTQFIDNVFSEGLKPQIIDQGKEICENIYNV